MSDKTAVCVDCGQTDLRECMIKSPRGFIHTFTRRCQNTWQSQVEAADSARDAAIARAEAAENDLRELRENTLLALGFNPVDVADGTEDATIAYLLNGLRERMQELETQLAATGERQPCP